MCVCVCCKFPDRSELDVDRFKLLVSLMFMINKINHRKINKINHRLIKSIVNQRKLVVKSTHGILTVNCQLLVIEFDLNSI